MHKVNTIIVDEFADIYGLDELHLEELPEVNSSFPVEEFPHFKGSIPEGMKYATIVSVVELTQVTAVMVVLLQEQCATPVSDLKVI
jgi:hypothetical protein